MINHTEADNSSWALERLRGVIREHGPMVIAFSGGVDSALLASVAHEVLGDRMMCAVGLSASFSTRAENDAVAFLQDRKMPYELLRPNEIEDQRYRSNSFDRCYFCKDALFDSIAASERCARFPLVAYGANTDDSSDHRPGALSARDRGVVAPLVDAGFDKNTVRAVARELGLSVWDKPASPCLASRIPYGTEVTESRLRQVEFAEEALRVRGFADCRVRHYGDVARVEVPLEEHRRLRAAEMWEQIEIEILAAGFKRVELMEDGLRSGRMNDIASGGQTEGA